MSIAEAHYTDKSWMRGIYSGDIPIGFILLQDPVPEEIDGDTKYKGRYFIWRFMIDIRYQGKGFGKNSIELLTDYVRTRPNADFLYTSYHPAQNDPSEFYRICGFEESGENIRDEIVVRLKL